MNTKRAIREGKIDTDAWREQLKTEKPTTPGVLALLDGIDELRRVADSIEAPNIAPIRRQAVGGTRASIVAIDVTSAHSPVLMPVSPQGEPVRKFWLVYVEWRDKAGQTTRGDVQLVSGPEGAFSWENPPIVAGVELEVLLSLKGRTEGSSVADIVSVIEAHSAGGAPNPDAEVVCAALATLHSRGDVTGWSVDGQLVYRLTEVGMRAIARADREAVARGKWPSYASPLPS